MSARRPRRLRLRYGVGRMVILVLVTVAMTGLGVYQVDRQYAVVAVGYALDRDVFEYRRQLEIRKRLELTLATYKDPIAVRAFAAEALEMREPGPEQDLHIPRVDEAEGDLSAGEGLTRGWPRAADDSHGGTP